MWIIEVTDTFLPALTGYKETSIELGPCYRRSGHLVSESRQGDLGTVQRVAV